MKYYSTKKVTEILGVTAQTLRNWDKEGKLKPSYVKSNGYRYYSEESILSYTQERKTKKKGAKDMPIASVHIELSCKRIIKESGIERLYHL